MMLAGLFLLLPLLVLHVDGDVECSPGRESCQDCYAELVSQLTDRDENYYNLQKAFLPPDKSSPVFVTVYYQFGDSCSTSNTTTNVSGISTQLVSNNTKVWFWSNTIFYLMQPLHVLQFTSLYFSDTETFTSEVCLVLDPECSGASDDFMKLLTQRLKVYATKSIVSSSIADRYKPVAESVETWRKWYHDNNHDSIVIVFNFIMFPPLTWILIVFAVFYYNDASPNSRLANYFSRHSESQEIEQKYHLQNEFILSFAIVWIAFGFSCAAAYSAVYTDNKANDAVADLYSCTSSCLVYSLPFILLAYDGMIFVALAMCLLTAAFRQNLCRKCKNNSSITLKIYNNLNDSMDRVDKLESGRKYREVIAQDPRHFLTWWRFFAYCIIFPLCCLANHLHYIIIALVHDLRHATATMLVFGGIFLTSYLILKGLPHITSLTLILCHCYRPNSKPDYRKRNLLIVKVALAACFAVYVVIGVALHFFIPDDTGFEDAISNIVTITSTSGAVVAIVTYFIIKSPSTSASGKKSSGNGISQQMIGINPITTLHQGEEKNGSEDEPGGKPRNKETVYFFKMLSCGDVKMLGGKPSNKETVVKLEIFKTQFCGGVTMEFMAYGQPLPEGEALPLPDGTAQSLSEDETLPLPDGRAQSPPEGEALPPPDGTAQSPPEGEAQLLPEGTAQSPPEGEAQLPPEGTAQSPPEGEGAGFMTGSEGPEGAGGLGQSDELPKVGGQTPPEGTRQPLPEGTGQQPPECVRQPLPEGEEQAPAAVAQRVQQMFGKATMIIRFINDNMSPILLELSSGDERLFSILLPHATPKMHRFVVNVDNYPSPPSKKWKVRSKLVFDSKTIDDEITVPLPYSLLICKASCTQEKFSNLCSTLTTHELIIKGMLEKNQDFIDGVEALASTLNMTVVEETTNFVTLYGKSIRNEDICILLFKDDNCMLKAILKGENSELIGNLSKKVSELFPACKKQSEENGQVQQPSCFKTLCRNRNEPTAPTVLELAARLSA